MVRSPLTAARATFALKAGEWFRRGRLLMVSPVHGDYRRCQAEIPLIVLFRFPGPALLVKVSVAGHFRYWHQTDMLGQADDVCSRRGRQLAADLQRPRDR